MSQRVTQRGISIRNATTMADNPLPPTRAAPPKPLKAGSTRDVGAPLPPPRSISELEMEAGGVVQHADVSKEQHNLSGLEKVTTIEDSESKIGIEKTSRQAEKSIKASDQIKGKFDGKQVEIFLFLYKALPHFYFSRFSLFIQKATAIRNLGTLCQLWSCNNVYLFRPICDSMGISKILRLQD